jgi:hypothetical protein
MLWCSKLKEMPWSCVYLILQRWSWFIGSEGYCGVLFWKIAIFLSGLQGRFNWWISRSPGVPYFIDRWSWCRPRTAGEKYSCNMHHNLTAEWFVHLNLLKSTSYLMHQQFNIRDLYALPALYLCVLYLLDNRQWLVSLTS